MSGAWTEPRDTRRFGRATAELLYASVDAVRREARYPPPEMATPIYRPSVIGWPSATSAAVTNPTAQNLRDRVHP